MNIMFTFPGQGTQVPGMLHQLPQTALTQSLLKQASDVLHQDSLTLDSVSALQSTRAVQLCLLIAGVAYASELIAQNITPDFTCGLSIGAFPAAVAAGALDFSDAVHLVALRGELMEQAYPVGYGLSAIVGLTRWQVSDLVNQVNSPDLPVYLANFNAEDQIVIAGSDNAMADVMRLAAFAGARKTQRLAVSVPSHCALLDKPANQLFQAMNQITFKRPTMAYLSGTTGRVLWQPDKIREDLAFNMARTVEWHDAMVAAYERDVRLAIEMPPGSVLTGLTKSVMQQGDAVSYEQSGIQVIKTLAERIQRTL